MTADRLSRTSLGEPVRLMTGANRLFGLQATRTLGFMLGFIVDVLLTMLVLVGVFVGIPIYFLLVSHNKDVEKARRLMAAQAERIRKRSFTNRKRRNGAPRRPKRSVSARLRRHPATSAFS